jgi:hypothetical protein
MEIAGVVGGNVQVQKKAQQNAEAVAQTLLQSVKEAPPPPGKGERVNIKA